MSALIDTLLPSWDVHEVHGIDVAAPPERTWAALERVTVGELPLTRLLLGVRALGRRSSARDRTFLEAAGFLLPLAEAHCDRVIGMVGKPWRLRPARAPISGAADFAGFDEPGWVRIATGFRVHATAGGSRLETETRIQATDEGARRSFARYWRVVGIGSALIRRDLLRATRRRAERSREGYLGLGSNVGDRRANLQAAVDALGGHGVEVLASSSVYETEPVGEVLDQPDFYNACVRVRTTLEPEALLDACKAVERELGRSSGGVRHGPRPIDVDVLLLGAETYRSERLSLPHEQVTSRRFVLVPLLELAPGLAVPGAGSAAGALAALGEDAAVRRAGEPLAVDGGAPRA